MPTDPTTGWTPTLGAFEKIYNPSGRRHQLTCCVCREEKWNLEMSTRYVCKECMTAHLTTKEVDLYGIARFWIECTERILDVQPVLDEQRMYLHYGCWQARMHNPMWVPPLPTFTWYSGYVESLLDLGLRMVQTRVGHYQFVGRAPHPYIEEMAMPVLPEGYTEGLNLW